VTSVNFLLHFAHGGGYQAVDPTISVSHVFILRSRDAERLELGGRLRCRREDCERLGGMP